MGLDLGFQPVFIFKVKKFSCSILVFWLFFLKGGRLGKAFQHCYLLCLIFMRIFWEFLGKGCLRGMILNFLLIALVFINC